MPIDFKPLRKVLELEHKKITGDALLKELNINPATVILVKNNSVVLPEEQLESKDEIRILSVISGG